MTLYADPPTQGDEGHIVPANPDMLDVPCGHCVVYAAQPCQGLPADRVHKVRAEKWAWKYGRAA